MFPVVAVGALITGAALTIAASAAASSSTASGRSGKKAARTPPEEGPQSPAAYMVVPVRRNENDDQPRPSLVELVGKLVI